MLQAKKDAISEVATRLLKANNTVSTLEIKAELFVKYPEYYWDQQMISDYMSVNHPQAGLSYTDNGTYRTYSFTNQPVNQPVVKRSVGRPRKSTPSVTPSVTPSKKASAPVTAPVSAPAKPSYISRTKAIELIEAAGGTYFTATFIKKGASGKPGPSRTMNCQYLKNQGAMKLGYVKVRIPGKLKAGESAIRNVNMQTLKELKIKGATYRVR